MASETLTRPLQETVLTLLAWDDDQGKIIANLVTAELFDGDYADVARVCLKFWKKYQEAPKQQLDDALGYIIDSKDPKAKTFREILRRMLHLYDRGVNKQHTVDNVHKFQRTQSMRTALLTAAGKINAEHEQALEEVEEIFANMLKVNKKTFDAGLKLTDVDTVLSFFENRQQEFSMGIGPLDKEGVCPARGAIVLILGPTGKGKSWALIHIAKQAMRMRKRVLHVTLEMPKEQVLQRYWQSLFSMTTRAVGNLHVPMLVRGEDGKLDRIEIEDVEAEFSFADPYVRDELTAHLSASHMDDYLRVIAFPSGSMEPKHLDAYLDMVYQQDGWVPDMIVLDYVGLMRSEGKDKRIAIGQNLIDLRGIAGKRHCAMITAQQASRAGAAARMVTTTHVAEDWSLTNTADIILTFSRLEVEDRIGVGRLYVSKCRDAVDSFGVMVTQNYALGQFALDAVRMESTYWSLIDTLGKSLDGGASTDATDEDDGADE